VRTGKKTHLSSFVLWRSGDIDMSKRLYRMGSQAVAQTRHYLFPNVFVKVKIALEQVMKIQKEGGGG